MAVITIFVYMLCIVQVILLYTVYNCIFGANVDK